MKSKRSPKSDLFVVWLPRRTLKQKEIEEIVDFDISAITELTGAYLAHSKDSYTRADVMKQRLHQIFGDEARILNVLQDEKGHILIPTGNISVVLISALSKQRLDEWAKSNRLKVISQSKWRPRAVLLATEKDEPSELNRALEALQNDPRVEIAEQEVLAHFQRDGEKTNRTNNSKS